MDIFKIDYKIISHTGELREDLLNYPKYQKDLHKMVCEDTMHGYIKITINDKVVTKWKDIDFDKFQKNPKLQESLIYTQNSIYQKGTQDYIGDYIYMVILRLLDTFILLTQRNKRKITAEFFDNPHELEFELDNSTLAISFICRCDLGWHVNEDGIYCHESTLKQQIPFEIAINEIIRATEDFLNQLIEINPRLKEWEGCKKLENKLTELKKLSKEQKDA